MTAQHKEQTASALRRAVQEVLARGLNDPRVRGLISVTSVKVSDDGATATVNVSIMPAEHEKLTMQGLRAAAGHIRSQISKSVRMRRMPKIVFEPDESIKREAAVLAAIRKANPEQE